MHPAASPPPSSPPVPSSSPANNHHSQVESLSYPQMIIAAINALKDRTRCHTSRINISKYIFSTYRDLPCNHRRLLTWHLEKMVDKRSLYMVKNDYYLPGTTESPKRRLGRKPKPKAPDQPSNVADVALKAQPDAVPDVGPVAGEEKKRRRSLSGKPLERPKKNALVPTTQVAAQELAACQDPEEQTQPLAVEDGHQEPPVAQS